MAFVARRNMEGKLVDCQVISGLGNSSSMTLSDLSDEEADSNTLQSYSNRSYGSPTVRYVPLKDDVADADDADDADADADVDDAVAETNADADADDDGDADDDVDDDVDNDVDVDVGVDVDVDDDEEDEEDDTDSCCTFDGSLGSGANNEECNLEAVMDFGNDQDIVGKDSAISSAGEDAKSEKDYQSDTASDEETVMSGLAKTPDTHNPGVVAQRKQDTDFDSIDGETVCHSRNFDLVQIDDFNGDDFFDNLSIGEPIVPPLRLTSEDARSICSTNSTSICRQTICASKKPDSAFSLGSMDSISVYDMIDEHNTQVDDEGHMTSRTFNLKSTTVRRDGCSSASTCSWTDMYGGALKPSESQSNVVPSLSLNLSTASSGSSTYFRNLDDEKERHGQEAYQEWVKRKERQKQQKQMAAKLEREKREAETAMRQRLAKERYQEWVRQKEIQQKKSTTASIKSATSYGSCSSSSSSTGMHPNTGKLHQRKETPEAIKKRLEEWERIKTQQQQRERERERLKRQTEQQLEKSRKQKSEGAWQNWMKTVGKRPKPVPLNQGFDTLRGTVSNIYVNPVQWVSNIDTNNSRGN